MRPSKFSPDVRAFIEDHNKGRTAAELTDLVNATFGESYTVQQIKSYRSRYHLISGLTGKKKKGHTPYNKGKKRGSYPGMEVTQYKKGNVPHNHRPVGSERITRDGYRERKIAEPKTWRSVHVLNWEAVHGPVPKGSVVIFKDRDLTNCDVSNLMLVTRAELVGMNQRGLISTSPELTETGQNIARLILTAAKQKKKRRGAP